MIRTVNEQLFYGLKKYIKYYSEVEKKSKDLRKNKLFFKKDRL